MSSLHPTPRLFVSTREIPASHALLAQASAENPLVWLRRGEGMIGVGTPVVTLRASANTDHDRTERLAKEWRALAAAASVDDELGIPGTGLVAFGTLVFDPSSQKDSVLVVPSTIVGTRGGRAWITTISSQAPEDAARKTPVARELGAPWSGSVGPGALSAEGYRDAVAEASRRMTAGDASKVVLARDLVGTVPASADLRRLVRALAEDYPDCWTFAVDGLIGASPETLITVEDGRVTARVLAGTRARGADTDADVAASVDLVSSAKDQEEHRYAVRSLLETLRPHTRVLAAAQEPFTLKLPNVWHLATDVEGSLSDGASALDLLADLHPTAAVGGTPTAAAMRMIRDLEPFDRGRYAGPVGWIDGSGNGEWAIALRCAQIDVDEHDGDVIPITAYAGAGILPESDPEAELLETRVKFRPIVDALA